MSKYEGNLAYGLPPEINRLLNSNDPRVDYQVEAITNSLGIARSLKGELGLQITQLRMELMRLEREELHATRHISRCVFALAPIRRVPTEILREIFLSYADLLGDSHECVDVKDGIWLLSHICSYWRVVALSTPELWTSCNFRCEKQCKDAPALVGAWLRHAGTRPLAVRFYCKDDSSEHRGKGHCRPVMTVLAARSAQWSELKLQIPASFYTHRDLELYPMDRRLPILQKLCIIACPRGNGSIIHSVFVLSTFSGPPRLRDVSLVSFELWSCGIILPWDQITSYSGAVSVNPQILNEALDLVDFTVCPSGKDVTPSLRLAEPLTHRLRHLRLHAGSLRPELLTLPALQSLRISAADISILQSVERLLQRSMASPTSLHIDEFAYSQELVMVLAATPSIAHLTVSAPTGFLPVSVTDLFFSSFVESGDTPPVLPALCTISIAGLPFGEAFVRMVELRSFPPSAENKWEGARLEALTVSDVRHTHISHILRIKNLETEAGLKFCSGALSAVRILG
ncbi:hypothetical protein DFH06DRAFT_1248000 [Mycena polygramma]|nr:hypothetical protein DFH06DRAFT_1248000 [Mycena polygramma]